MKDKEVLNKIAEMTTDYRPYSKEIPFFHRLKNYHLDDRLYETQEEKEQEEMDDSDPDQELRRKKMKQFTNV